MRFLELGRLLVNALVRAGLQGAEELAAAAVLHAEVEMVLGLEGVVEGDDERVVGGGEDLLLGERALDLVALDHLLFRQHCSGVSAGASEQQPPGLGGV